MDKPTLVAPDLDRIARGDELLKELRDAGFPIHRALWWYSPEEYSDWRLVIASALVDERGPLAAYRKLDAILRKQRPDLILWLRSIHLMSPKEQLIRELDKTYPPREMRSKVTSLSGSTAGNTFIEQAYLYSPLGTTE
jgi:hypothetical protein